MAQKTVGEYKQTDVSRRPGETERAYAVRLFKQADQRMVRNEKLAKEQGFEHVLSYAYAKAQKELAGYGQSRFNAKIPDPDKDPKLFRAKLAIAKEYLTAPTSTKSGIVNVYQNKADVINQKYGTNFNWQDMGDFFESGQFQKLSAQYGSKTVMRAIGSIHNATKVVDSMGKNTNLKVDDIQKEVALKLLRSSTVKNAIGLDKEQAGKVRNAIRNASDWLDASETDIEDYFND